jgi:pyrroline-5-carboxylate reductase
MATAVGLVKSCTGGSTLADVWPRDAGRPDISGLDVILSPPATLQEVAKRSSLIILELSADELGAMLPSLGASVSPGAAVVSTNAAASLELMRFLVGPGPALFRAVVPLGTEPGEGVAALVPEPGTAAEPIERVRGALEWIGLVELVSEETLDAVAALALGGAAFMCKAVEGLEEGAVHAGLPRETARSFTRQTALATALLLREHSGSPADLKDQVASPGGTTIAALATLEDAGVRGAFIRAVQRSAAGIRGRRDAARPGVIE